MHQSRVYYCGTTVENNRAKTCLKGALQSFTLLLNQESKSRTDINFNCVSIMEEKDSECVGQRLEAGETVRLACTTDLFS